MINWINGMLTPSQKAPAAKAHNTGSVSSAYMNQILPIEGRAGQSQQQTNPFMAALNPDSNGYKESYGVNRPLDKPMFLGYRDNKALYGGAKLFILY